MSHKHSKHILPSPLEAAATVWMWLDTGERGGAGGWIKFHHNKKKKKRRGLHESERADGWKTERNTRMRYSQKIKSVLVGTGVYCKGKWNSCSLSDVFMYLCDHTAVGDVGLTLTVHTVIAPYICPGSSATSHWTLTFTVFILWVWWKWWWKNLPR